MDENGFEPLSFFQYTPVGLVGLAAGILYMGTIGKKLLPNRDGEETPVNSSFSPNQLAGFYKIYHSLYLVKVGKESSIIEKSLASLKLTQKYGITIVAINRSGEDIIPLIKNSRQIIPKAHTSLEAGDLLLLFGELDKTKEMVGEYNLNILKNQTDRDARKHLLSRQFGVNEVLISPQSSYHMKTVRELHFRRRFGCTVLTIHRNGKYIQKDVGKEKLQVGDALLIHGKWERIELLAETTNDIVVGRVSDTVATAVATGKAPIAGAIMLFMLLLMTLEIVEPVIAVLVSAFLMIITGCFRSTGEAYQRINWESVLLIAAMLPMATALEKTGGVLFMSDSLLGGYGPYAVLAGFYILTMVLSQFISNTATAVIFAPIAITAAIGLEVSPYPFVMTVAVAASMAFATPVASPANALVMNAGGYTFKDFVKVGVPLQLFLAIIMIPIIPLFFPF